MTINMIDEVFTRDVTGYADPECSTCEGTGLVNDSSDSILSEVECYCVVHGRRQARAEGLSDLERGN